MELTVWHYAARSCRRYSKADLAGIYMRASDPSRGGNDLQLLLAGRSYERQRHLPKSRPLQGFLRA